VKALLIVTGLKPKKVDLDNLILVDSERGEEKKVVPLPPPTPFIPVVPQISETFSLKNIEDEFRELTGKVEQSYNSTAVVSPTDSLYEDAIDDEIIDITTAIPVMNSGQVESTRQNYRDVGVNNSPEATELSGESSFDIRDQVKPMHEQKLPELPVGDGKKKQIFSEIFEEEAQADLKVLIESIEALDSGKVDIKILRDIKASCNSLKNTAQLFSFEMIDKLAGTIISLIDVLLIRKEFPAQPFCKLIEDVPDTLQDLMADEDDAVKRANELIYKMDELIQTLSIHGNSSKEKITMGEEKKSPKSASFSNMSQEANSAIDSSKMNDALQHMKNLFKRNPSIQK
jgi:hypothetical protein